MKTSELLFNYLKEEGLVPKFNDNGNIAFKYQMRNFLFFVDDNDNAFFNLTLPCIYDVTDDNRMAVFEAMNQVNESTKVVKLTIANNSVWCATEIMMDSTPEMEDLVPRLLNILLTSREKFYKAIE